MTVLHLDLETRSTVDLKKTGVYVYANHCTTDVWCACYAFDDGPIETWTPGQPFPDEMFDHLLDGGVIVAHNAAFERVVWHYILGPRYGWFEPDIEQWRCTMVGAYSMGFPGALELAAPAAGLDVEKDMKGNRLMKQMMKPRKTQFAPNHDSIPYDALRVGPMGHEGWETYKAASGEKIVELQWWNAPEKIERLIDYCKTDVEVERQLEKRLRPLKESEQKLWFLDQKINDRGILIDAELAEAATKIVQEGQKRLNAQMRDVTDKAVTATTNVNQIVDFIQRRGVDTETIKKDVLEELLAVDSGIAPEVRAVLELRREGSKASVSKLNALLRGKSPEDGRSKGMLQFYAASTGRWGGRRFQPQNLRRPETEDINVINLMIETLFSGDFNYVDMAWDDPITVVAETLRGLLISARNKVLRAADYSNIEGRVLAWLAGESWKLEAFRAFDNGTGHDLYLIGAGKILNKQPQDVSKPERQAYGKVPELALGYQGGVGAFVTMGANYGVNLPTHQVETIRDGWREAHPMIKQFWYDMENAAIDAVNDPGISYYAGNKIRFKMTGSFLAMQLPSKRFLFYPYPEIRRFEVPWTNSDGSQAYKSGLTYMSGIDQSKRSKVVDDPRNTSRWARIKTYGGMLAENATQATARDIMADAMPRLEAAGYPIVLTVHDEIVAECEKEVGSVAEMEEIMCELPAWAAGLPVAVDGFEDVRYRK